MSSRILRQHPLVNYQEGSNQGHRKILGADKTASITKHAKEILNDAAAMRVTETITHFLVDFTISHQLNIPLVRARTDSQGASSSNTAFTPSKHNEARHLEIAATVHAKLKGPLQDISQRIENKNALTPQTERELRLLKLKTPKRNAIAQSPARVQEIIHTQSQKPVDILRNTYYGNRKHMTYSSLSISNQFDRMVEFRLRPLWDRLMQRASENIKPTDITLEFAENFEQILTRLHSLTNELQTHLTDFFELEEKLLTLKTDDESYVPTLKQLLDKKTWICSHFSSCREINAIKYRRQDWYLVKKITLKDELQHLPFLKNIKNLEDKQKILNAATNLHTESTFQLQNVKSANNKLAIENLSASLFGEKPEADLRDSILNMLSPLPKKEQTLTTQLDFEPLVFDD